MAQKNRSQLVSDSDSTFLDNNTGQIIPENHRQFNDDFIESAASVVDNNVFGGENSFDMTIYSNVGGGVEAFNSVNGGINIGGASNFDGSNIFNGDNEFNAQVKVAKFVQTQIATYIASDGTIDLTDVEGNIIYIDGTETIGQFIGSVGQVFYVTIVDGLIIDAQGGYSVRPPHNISLNPGDTIVFHFTETDVIRILGHWRQNGQQYFELADVAAYVTLASASALQIGSQYFIQDAYEYPTDFYWSVLVKAISPSNIDSTAYIRRSGAWVAVKIFDGTLSAGTLQITSETNASDLLSFAEYNVNSSQPQWTYGAKVFVGMDGDSNVDGAFYGYGMIDEGNNPVKRNLLNIGETFKAFIGRIDYSTISDIYKFFTHHGKSTTSWGNNPVFENGFTNIQVQNINNNDFLNYIDFVSVQNANYIVVNDVVTINACVTMSTKFNQGVNGHEALLYFPLPFINNELGCGHGSLRFESIANHQNIGVIVSPQDTYMCLVSAKWGTSINTDTDVNINFSFTYVTDPVG